MRVWVEGVSKIPHEIHGFRRSNESKVSAISKVSRASGISPRGHGFQGYNMSTSPKVSKALGRQVSKVKGIQG